LASGITSRHFKTFSEHFKSFEDMYVLIGGSATSLLMEEAGLNSRTTKDLDLVLCVEALDDKFVNRFWEFVRLGGYSIINRSTGEKCFYRFTNPVNDNYPFMLEILSNNVDILGNRDSGSIVTLTIKDELVSLSAILLIHEYYEFIMALKTTIQDITIADHRVIIPLKSRAYLDLIERKQMGEHVNADDIKKHKNDIFRLSQLLVKEFLNITPEVVKHDIRRFVTSITDDDTVLKQLKINDLSMNEIKETLMLVYCNE